MQKPTKPFPKGLSRPRLLGLLAGAFALHAQGALADSAYIQQALGNYQGSPLAIGLLHKAPANLPDAGRINPYELTAGSRARNLAESMIIGSNNLVAQIQTGLNDSSNVGILGGDYNNVAVLQTGNSLRSNVVLLNTRGMNIGVLQPNGAAPVDMLVARLPNGSLIIRP